MGRKHLCLLGPAIALFVCSLVWISTVDKPITDLLSPEIAFAGNSTGDFKEFRDRNNSFPQATSLNQPTESDWDLFLLRRGVPLPSLSSSLHPWSLSTMSTQSAVIPPLREQPDLRDTANVTCAPLTFGLNRTEAQTVYGLKRQIHFCSEQPQTNFITVREK